MVIISFNQHPSPRNQRFSQPGYNSSLTLVSIQRIYLQKMFRKYLNTKNTCKILLKMVSVCCAEKQGLSESVIPKFQNSNPFETLGSQEKENHNPKPREQINSATNTSMAGPQQNSLIPTLSCYSEVPPINIHVPTSIFVPHS